MDNSIKVTKPDGKIEVLNARLKPKRKRKRRHTDRRAAKMRRELDAGLARALERDRS
jgi:hypothetical protein